MAVKAILGFNDQNFFLRLSRNRGKKPMIRCITGTGEKGLKEQFV
jgi:hypothetical protein